MNIEKERWRKRVEQAEFFVTIPKELLAAILDYVDTLEEIVECVARNRNTALGHQAREALDKGK